MPIRANLPRANQVQSNQNPISQEVRDLQTGAIDYDQYINRVRDAMNVDFENFNSLGNVLE